MKMPAQWYGKVKDGIQAIVDYYGPDYIEKVFAGKSMTYQSWGLLRILMQNWGYDDNHPCFADGSWDRILPYQNVNYNALYDLGLHDDHIATALRRIAKELGLK